MASEASEALADIVAEMRYGAIPKHQTDHELLAIYADRIEAAHKRERDAVGNAAKLREALSAALEQVNKVYDILSRPCVFIAEARQGCREARGILIPALAKPPRNCDVGKALVRRDV